MYILEASDKGAPSCYFNYPLNVKRSKADPVQATRVKDFNKTLNRIGL